MWKLFKTLFGNCPQTDCFERQIEEKAASLVEEPQEAPSEVCAPESCKIMMYGQCRTFADIVKTLNQKNHYRFYDTLLSDFRSVIEKYEKRGSVNSDSLNIIETVITDNMDELFGVNGFEFEHFIEMLEGIFTDEGNCSTIDAIYTRRQRTKLLILLKTLNDICHYTDMHELVDDLSSIATGRFSCGDNSLMNDPYPQFGNYPINWFVSGLHNQWANVTVNGVLDNELLEKVMFADHTTKVSTLGIDQVIADDYEGQGPCHPEVFFPKQVGTAPVYVYDKDSRKYSKACGEGKGPRRGFGWYELELVKPILWREKKKGNYKLLDSYYYIPIGTYDKPVFIDHFGRVEFASIDDKRKYIDEMLQRASLYDND